MACGNSNSKPTPTDGGVDAARVPACGDGTVDPGELCFQEPINIPSRAGGESVSFDDLNEDGTPDILSTHFALDGTASVCLHLSSGPGSFPACAGSLADMARLSVFDLDSDGHLDVVGARSATDPAGSEPFVLWGAGDGTFPETTQLVMPADPDCFFIGVGHLNFDTEPDIVHQTSATRFSVQLNAGNRGFSLIDPDYDILEEAPTGGPRANTEVRVLDIDKDDAGDIVVANERGLVLGDFNGDGFIDVASRGDVWLIEGDGDGALTLSPQKGRPGVNLANATNGDWTINDSYSFADYGPIGADVDNDGDIDLVTIAVNGGEPSVRILLGTGDGLFTTETEVSLFPAARATRAFGVRDLNNDGVVDIVVYDDITLSLVLLLSNP